MKPGFVILYGGYPSLYSIDYAAQFDGSTSKATITLTTSSTHSGYVALFKGKNGATLPIIGTSIYFNTSDQLVINGLTSTAVFRDAGAFYFFFWNASGAWVAKNGGPWEAVAGTGTYATASISNPVLGSDGSNFFYGSMANFAFWDGTSESQTGLTLDAATNNPIPTAISGAHTFLEFKNSGSMGDNSGSGGDWTPTALTQVTSTPTNKVCALDPNTFWGGSSLSDGNLTLTPGSTNDASVYGTLRIPAGTKCRFEGILSIDAGSGSSVRIGVTSEPGTSAFVRAGSTTNYWAFEFDANATSTGVAYDEGSSTNYGTNAATGSVCGIYIDASAGKMYAHDDGVFYNSGDPDAGTGAVITTLPTDQDLFVHVSVDAGGANVSSITMVFDENDLSDTSSTFPAICTNNLPAQTGVESAFIQARDTGTNIVSTLDAAIPTSWGSDETIKVYRDTTTGADWKQRFSDDSANMLVRNSTAIPTTWSAPSGSNQHMAYAIRVNASVGVFSQEISHTTGTATDTAHGLGTSRGVIEGKRTDATDNWQIIHPDLPAGYYKPMPTASTLQTSGAIYSMDGTNVTIAASAATGTYRVTVFADDVGLPFFACAVAGNSSADGSFANVGRSPVADWNIQEAARGSQYLEMRSYTHDGNDYNPTSVIMNDGYGTGGTSSDGACDRTSEGTKERNTSNNFNAGYTYYRYGWGTPDGPVENAGR